VKCLKAFHPEVLLCGLRKRGEMRRGVVIRLSICAIFVICIITGRAAFAATTSQTSSVSVGVQSVFSVEFYTDKNVIYTDVIPFTNVDPTKSVAYPDGRQENDGKSDTAVICRSNSGSVWYLKLHVIPNPPLAADRIKYYIDQPYNRNTGGKADGALTKSAQWYSLSETPTAVYAAGFQDKSNLPFGTLAAFSFSLNPTGLDAGKSYSAAIVYTMSTSP